MKKPKNRPDRTPPARSSNPLLPSPRTRAGRTLDWRLIVVGAALLVATLAAYYPAWHGGILWDDDHHVTSVELRPLDGLRRIWFEFGATEQYYPLVHSAFWLQHRLWGDDTLGYHLVNIVLHALAAVLLLIVLRRLDVPGAVLAAFLFALHPAQAESVAWITELKNTLSGVFFLSSALLYLRFDRDRAWQAYAGSAAMFVLALLSKSVTVTLPAVLLVVFWWRRGRLGWRRDVVPLLPFFAVAVASGLLTAWVERTLIGAQGSEFSLTIVERAVLAGRLLWFYLAELVWPAHVTFMPPRWDVSQPPAWQYLYVLGFAGLLAGLWVLRGRSRGPLAALLVFAGTLFPVLGFFDVFWFRFSFVGDHFLYLPSMPIFALAAAGAATAARRWAPGARWLPAAASLALGAVLATLTWLQSGTYVDAPTHYRATLARNPASWLAHGNLGAMLRRDDPRQALVHLTEAVRLKPDLVEGQYNLATALQQVGRLDEAAARYREVIRLAPTHARAHCNLGNTLQQLGLPEEAERSYRESIRLSPRLVLAHSGLCRVLQANGRLDEARSSCETAVTLDPGLPSAHRDLADVLLEQGRIDEAIHGYTMALRLQPDEAEAHGHLASAFQQAGRFDEAIGHFREAARLDPASAQALIGLCATLRSVGRLDEARQHCSAAVRLRPDLVPARVELANTLEQGREHAAAVAEYAAALRMAPGLPEVHCAVSISLAHLGRVQESRDHQNEALRLCPDAVSAHASMGYALEGIGRLPEARAEYEEALRLDPGFVLGRVALARIDARLRLTPSATPGPPVAGR